MSIVTYAKTSPYYKTPQYSWRIGLFVNRSIPPAGDDQQITLALKYQYRPDLLSYDLYGSPEYWWVFMARNIDIIREPMWDMVAGISIYVPSLTYLQTVVG